MNYVYVVFYRKKDRNWLVGFFIGNGIFLFLISMDGYLFLFNGIRNVIMNSVYGVEIRVEIDKLVQFNNLLEGKDVQFDIKYCMFVIFGVFFCFDLSDDWVVEIGVIYIQFLFEICLGIEKNNYGWEEKLYYVGIFLKVNWNIWSNKWFEVYVLVGGVVEKCVFGKWSIIGSVFILNVGKDEQFLGGEENVKVKFL